MQILSVLTLLQHTVHEKPTAVCPTLLLCTLQPEATSLMGEQMLGCRITAVHQTWEPLNIMDGDCQPDGDVDWADLACLASNWLDSDCGTCNGADFNGDGKVNFYDFASDGGELAEIIGYLC